MTALISPINKATTCQYYSRIGSCKILKVDLLQCPERCSFYKMGKQEETSSRELADECCYLQYEGDYAICCLKGEIVTSCAGCQSTDSINNYLPYPDMSEFI